MKTAIVSIIHLAPAGKDRPTRRCRRVPATGPPGDGPRIPGPFPSPGAVPSRHAASDRRTDGLAGNIPVAHFASPSCSSLRHAVNVSEVPADSGPHIRSWPQDPTSAGGHTSFRPMVADRRKLRRNKKIKLSTPIALNYKAVLEPSQIYPETTPGKDPYAVGRPSEAWDERFARFWDRPFFR